MSELPDSAAVPTLSISEGVRYTPRQLAAFFPGTSTENVRSWEQTGKISPAIKTPGGHRRFSETHVGEIAKYLGPPKRS